MNAACSGEKRIEKGGKCGLRTHPTLPCSNNLRCEPATEPAIHGTLLKTFVKKSGLMKVSNMEADMILLQ
jgi:hypothetical protein